MDYSIYWLASDAREVAEEYSKLPTPESKNMIRGALGLSPLNTNVKTATKSCSIFGLQPKVVDGGES